MSPPLSATHCRRVAGFEGTLGRPTLVTDFSVGSRGRSLQVSACLTGNLLQPITTGLGVFPIWLWTRSAHCGSVPERSGRCGADARSEKEHPRANHGRSGALPELRDNASTPRRPCSVSTGSRRWSSTMPLMMRCGARRASCRRLSGPGNPHRPAGHAARSTSTHRGPRRRKALTGSVARLDTFTGQIVIVGASLAGLRAARHCVWKVFTGRLTLIGDEPHRPYDRPPLSKTVLSGWLPSSTPPCPVRRRRRRVAPRRPGYELDLAGHRVHLADGQEVEFDRPLITTGTRARQWPNEDEAALDGVFTSVPATTPHSCASGWRPGQTAS